MQKMSSITLLNKISFLRKLIYEEYIMQELIKRLRVACRRGMLELDLLLGDFLEQQFSTLDKTQQAQFQLLLENSDQDLYSWLLGFKQPSDPATTAMIDVIRHYAQTKN